MSDGHDPEDREVIDGDLASLAELPILADA